MKEVDVALVGLLGIFALRGFLRGFFRESFGFLALVAGILCALQFTGVTGERLSRYITVFEAARPMIVFVGIFVLVHGAINLLGLLLDRIASSLLFLSVSRVTGAAFGVFKGAAVASFVLLFLHLFPVLPEIDRQIAESQFARPLVDVASTVVRSQWRPPGENAGPARV